MKYLICTLFFFLTLFMTPRQLPGQQDSSRTIPANIENDLSMAWHHAGVVSTSPLHFSANEWLTTGAVVAGTLILFSVDESARSLAQRNQTGFGNNLSTIGDAYGGTYGVVLSGGLYAAGLIANDKEIRKTGLMLLESVGFSFVATTVLKVTIGRSRPFLGDGARTFNPFQFHEEKTSLPSGHTTAAFAISSVLAERIKNPFATIGLYSLATVTAFSRVYQDEHWVSDAFLGAAIGTAFGIGISRLHENDSTFSLFFSPTPNGFQVGLRL